MNMVKKEIGKPTAHVLTSHGADRSLNKFYITQYSTSHTKGYENFQPRTGRHVGTGYLSNFRPQIFYSANLDRIDNPVMGGIIAGNYESITQRHFVPYQTPDGKEPLPMIIHQKGTGFVRSKGTTVPTDGEVKGVAIDTRLASMTADILPKHRSHLQKIQAKDPTELENGAYGPAYMSTETQSKFQEKPLNGPQVDMTTSTLGPNELSGYTHNKNVEPVTFHPDYAHKGDMPHWMTSRPTGTSIYKTNYNPYGYPHGDEKNAGIMPRSERGSGFTYGTKSRPAFVNRVMEDAYDKADSMPPQRLERLSKVDPAEFVNATHPHNGSGLFKNFFLGKQRPDPSAADRLGRTDVGWKEPSGYAENNDTWAFSRDDRARFITNYMTKFDDPTLKGKAREGFVEGGAQVQKADGFTKSTQVHSYGTELNTTAALRAMHPYVARSVQSGDTFFDDHLYDSKTHSGQAIYRSHTVA